MKNLAIIPARSGSKRLPDKNIKHILGKPLMGYSINAALESGVFDEVMVATDSEAYAQIARGCGAEVPFLRGAENAGDTASSWDMVQEILDKYKTIGKQFDTFCLLQPTSPLRTADDIRGAYKEYETKCAFSVISICECEHTPLWSGLVKEDCSMKNFFDYMDSLQQYKKDTFYRLNGAIYIMDVGAFEKTHFLYGENSYAYIMPINRSIDIDTEFDFELAEFYLNKMK